MIETSYDLPMIAALVHLYGPGHQGQQSYDLPMIAALVHFVHPFAWVFFAMTCR